jgi:hypothetical protein
LALRAHVGGSDAEPAAHRSTPHLHRFRAGRGHELVELHRIHPHENTTLPACRNRHVPAHEEREPTEHPLFGDAALVTQEVAYAVSQFLVVCHFGLRFRIDLRARTGRRSTGTS